MKKQTTRILLMLMVVALLFCGCNTAKPGESQPGQTTGTSQPADNADPTTEAALGDDMELDFDELTPGDNDIDIDTTEEVEPNTKPVEEQTKPTQSVVEKEPEENTQPAIQQTEPSEETPVPTEPAKVPGPTNSDGSIQLPWIPG